MAVLAALHTLRTDLTDIIVVIANREDYVVIRTLP